MFDEDRMRSQTKWKGLCDLSQEIPDFPLQRFPDLTEGVERGEYLIAVDNGIARELYPFFSSGYLSNLLNELLLAVPLLISAIAIGAVMYSGNWVSLLGAPVALGCFLVFGIPKPFSAPFGGVGMLLTLTLSIVLIWAWAFALYTIAFLSLAFVVTFVSVRTTYARSAFTLRLAILRSEALFLYLFERFGCSLKDKRTGKVFSVVDCIAGEHEQKMTKAWKDATSPFMQNPQQKVD